MKPVIIIIISVLIIGVSITSISAQSSTEIPSWIKSSVEFWVNGDISDSEFLTSLEFLIENNIIEIPKITQLEKENNELKNNVHYLEVEEKRLRTVIDNIKSNPYPYDTREVEEEIDPSQLSVQELKQQIVTWEYDDILRNEEYYVGKIIHLTGEISSIEKYSGDDPEYDHWVLFTVDTGESNFDDGGYFGDGFYVWYDGSRLLMGDIIEVYLIVDDVIEEEFIKGYPSYSPIGTAKHVTCTSC